MELLHRAGGGRSGGVAGGGSGTLPSQDHHWLTACGAAQTGHWDIFDGGEAKRGEIFR